MDAREEQISECAAKLVAAYAEADARIAELLAMFEESDAADRGSAAWMLTVAEQVGRNGQANEGALILLLAQADRVKAHPAGLAAWINIHLDVTDGRARGLAQSARAIGHLPELAEPLTSGRYGAGTIRSVTRAVCAAKGTDTDVTETVADILQTASRDGVSEANRKVRILEEKLAPGHAEDLLARQQQRRFARVLEGEDGMCRIEALLDAEGATTVRAALDAHVSATLRARQYDDEEIPREQSTVEQIQAHALIRFAEVYLSATPQQRGTSFTAPTVYFVPLDESTDAGLATSAYDTLMPRKVAAPRGNSAAHLLEHRNGQPVRLDGEPVDHDPARLATPAQRIALGWRDRTCTEPGCNRPLTWSLHAHHVEPYSKGGPTAVENLRLMCPRHHTLTHHPGL